MAILFGLAGIAEMVFGLELMLQYFVSFVLLSVALWGAYVRSSQLTWCAILLSCFVGIFFFPSVLFTTIISDDPDVHHWAKKFRMFSIFWTLSMSTVVLAAVRTFLNSACANREPSNSDVQSANNSR